MTGLSQGTGHGDRPPGAGAAPRWTPRQPEIEDETVADGLLGWRFGLERVTLSQLFAARIEVARRDPSAAARAGTVAALIWQHGEAMRDVTYRQYVETVSARLRRRDKARERRSPPSQ